jgi:hypothetical protein
MDRVSLALFSYYREDPQLGRRLDPLLACRLSRSWGALRIECRDLAHRAVVNELIELLRPPIEALQLARQISLLVPGFEPLTYPVTVPLPSSLLA